MKYRYRLRMRYVDTGRHRRRLFILSTGAQLRDYISE